jgi:uncharacterized protein YdhG (YjbR/CyaY superfamily)
MARFDTPDDYIASFAPETRAALESVRQAIRSAAPGTEEGISYGIPAFKLGDRYVVWFAGWKRHISVYPIPSGDASLDAELAPYAAAKGTLRFRLDRPVPLGLIARIAAELVRQQQTRQR